MIFIDTSIIMYAAGSEHPYKKPSLDLLKLIAVGEIEAVINVEVLQEILHRYTMINMKDKGHQAGKEHTRTCTPCLFS